jgi:uncharacterized protein (DUF111 family)
MCVLVEVTGGSVAVKIAHRDGRIVQATPEFSEETAAAAAASLPPSVLLQESITAAWNAGLRPGEPVPVTDA